MKSEKSENVIAWAVLTFGSIAILTVFILGDSAMNKELTREEFDTLDTRVKKIEEHFKPPNGGFPELVKLVEQLDVRISGLQNTSATKEDVDDLKRIVAELKLSISNQKQTFRVQPSN